MNMIQLAGLILVLNLCFGIVNGIGILGSSAPDVIGDQISDNMIVEVLTGTSTVSVLSSVLQVDQYLFAAIELFILFFQMTMNLPLMLGSAPFNWPVLLTTPLVLLQTLIYALGIAEFLRGFSAGG